MMIGLPNQRARRCAVLVAFVLGAASLATASAQSENPSDGKKFKDWTVRCEQYKDGEGAVQDQCHMFQDWHHKERGLRILHVAVAYPPQRPEQAVAVLTMPLGIYLPLGVQLQVDQNQPIKFPVERCETWNAGKDDQGQMRMDGGCKAGLQIKDELLTSLKKGAKAFVTFHDMRRTPVRVPVSLSGFTAGLRSLK